MNTKGQEVIESFESSFQDKNVIPDELACIWLIKAVARYSIELEDLEYDRDIGEFNTKLSQYVIDTLAAFMKQSYMEREISKINKRVSIVTKDLSIDGNGNSKSAAKNELDYINAEAQKMTEHQKPSAYV